MCCQLCIQYTLNTHRHKSLHIFTSNRTDACLTQQLCNRLAIITLDFFSLSIIHFIHSIAMCVNVVNKQRNTQSNVSIICFIVWAFSTEALNHIKNYKTQFYSNKNIWFGLFYMLLLPFHLFSQFSLLLLLFVMYYTLTPFWATAVIVFNVFASQSIRIACFVVVCFSSLFITSIFVLFFV